MKNNYVTTALPNIVFNKSKLALNIALVFAGLSMYANAEKTNQQEEQIETIMVTGQKFARPLQETPTSVTVFTSSIIEEQNISELSDVLFETANVHSTSSGNFNIRGIDGFNVSGAGTSSLASVYVDNAPLPERLIKNGISTWDMSQVEVLRGPQSTLQGRNALAGAVVMTSATPTHEWQGKYRIQFGQNGEKQGAVAFGGGIIDNQLAFRVSAEKEDFDGYNYNTIRNEDADFIEDALYRVKLLLTPEVTPDFTAQLNFTRSTTTKGTTGIDVPESGNPHDQRYITNNDPQTLQYDIDLISLNMTYDINEYWELSSITTHSDSFSQWKDFDSDNSPLDEGTRYFREEDKSLSHEFRLSFDYDNISGVIGTYYFDQTIESDFGGVTPISLRESGVSAEFLSATYGLDTNTANFVIQQYAPFDPAILSQLSYSDQDITSYAIFTDVTYNIDENWDVFAGFRIDKEKQINDDSSNFTVANLELMPNPANYPAPVNQLIAGINGQLLASVASANNASPLGDASFTEFIPKLGLSYRWATDITTSFTIQQGYRSGGVGVNTARSTSHQFEPEFTTNYEFSFRSQWLEGKLTANANVFYIDWEEQQVSVQLTANSFDTETKNAGNSRVKGFEFELNYQVNPELVIYSSLGLAQTEFTNFLIEIPTGSDLDNNGVEDVITRDLAGRSFEDAPEITANIGSTYKGDNGIFANISINYADDSNAEVNPYRNGLTENDIGFDLKNDARTLVNMQIGYEWDVFGVYLIGKNILDEEYISGAAFGRAGRVIRHTLGDPRQLSLNLRSTF